MDLEHGVDVAPDVDSLTNSSEFVPDFICNPCKQDGGAELEAVGYCMDCKEYLCATCFKHHLRPRPCRNHRLVGTYDMPKDGDTPQNVDTCVEHCDAHINKIVEFVCMDHDTLGCSTCMTIAHRQCTSVKSIPNIAVDYRDCIHAVKRKIAMTINRIEDEFGKMDETEKVGRDKLEANRTKINEIRMKVNDAFDTTLLEAEQLFNAHEDLIKRIKDRYVAMKLKLEQIEEDLDEKAENNQHCQLFVAMKKAETTLTQSDQDFETVHGSDYKTHDFVPSEGVLNLSLTGSLKAIGHFETSRRKLRKATSTKCSFVDVIGLNPSTCNKNRNITDSTLLSDGRLVLVDSENSRVNVVDLKRKREVFGASFENRPFSATGLGTQRLAVTLPEVKSVALFTITDSSLIFKRMINVGVECRALASIKDQLIVSLANSDNLRIIDINGDVTMIIKPDTQHRALFQGPTHIAVSPTGVCVYVSNYYNSSVACLSLDGKILSVYKGDDLKRPRGITIGSDGKVYVCGEESNNVLLLSPDCRDKGRVLLDQSSGIENPQNVAFCSGENKLYVTFLRKNYVEVYKAA